MPLPTKCPECGSTNIYCRQSYFKTAPTKCVCLACGHRWEVKSGDAVDQAFEGKKKEKKNATKKGKQ